MEFASMNVNKIHILAYVLCEVFFAEVEGVSMTRQRMPVSVEGMGAGNILRLMFDQAH